MSLASGALAEDAVSTARAGGIVTNGAIEKGVIWLNLWNADIRYEAPVADVPDADAIFAALKDSNDSRRSVAVDYDIDSGDVDPDTGVITFVFRDIVYQDKQIAGAKTPASPHRLRAETPGPQIARAIALADANRPQEARADFDLALKTPNLTPAMRSTALKRRAELLEQLAMYWTEAGEGRDALFVAALADARAYRQLHPDVADTAFEEVDLLDDLGAYAAAMRELTAMRKSWPDEDFRISVKIAATYRIMGDSKSALQTLDDYVARAGPQKGMKYHYHRSWILTNLGRFKEAADEITEGLKSQPDYAWAFQRRACALAMDGRLKEALDDQETAARLTASYHDTSPGQKVNMAWQARVTEQLRAAVAQGSTTPVHSPCEGYWDDGAEGGRKQSALLASTD